MKQQHSDTASSSDSQWEHSNGSNWTMKLCKIFIIYIYDTYNTSFPFHSKQQRDSEECDDDDDDDEEENKPTFHT